MLQHLVDGLRELGRDISPAQIEMFELYRLELLRWNRYTNLTAITDPAQVELRHFLDSLTVLQALDTISPLESQLKMIDVGTGAGFPGIPLKVMLTDCHLVLLEATGKRVAFLTHIIDLLRLSGSEVVQGRAEDVAHDPTHRESYGLVVARAVAPLATLAELCLPFASMGSLFVALKKGELGEELYAAQNAVKMAGGGDTRVITVRLPQLADDRRLVCIRKVAASPDRLPRRPGIPSKRPL